ncbi:MAG: type 1 glutamine amidotransferase domain-containing protein [Ilumatobacteraceae bacterium]
MAGELSGTTIAFMVANEGVERVELTRPWQAVEDAGGTAVLIAPKTGAVQTFDHLDKADVVHATVSTEDARADDYDGIVLPGGVANPDQLRMDGAAVDLLRAVAERGRPIAVICHGPWSLIEADLVRDRTITSWPSLQTDLRNAGATWVDEELVECSNGPFVLLSSRKPDDLPAFCGGIRRVMAGQRTASQA